MNGNGETESTLGIEQILIIFRSLNVGNVYAFILHREIVSTLINVII